MPSDDGWRTLASVGLPESDIAVWAQSEPPQPSIRNQQRASEKGWLPYEAYIRLGNALLGRLPLRATRTEDEQAAADMITSRLREKRTEFLRSNAEYVYGALTSGSSRAIRAEELVKLAADRYPGLTPDADLMSREASLPLKEKSGHEIDQGLFLWQILSDHRAGAHLVHSMLRPTPEASDLLEGFRRTGHVDLDLATVTRQGNIGIVEHRNTAYLNAEDDDTNRALEIAIDLVILDPACDAGVLRGGLVTHPKFAGRRVFNAGLNLTRLYEGRLPFLFYMTRDLGLVNKIYRGHSPEAVPSRGRGDGRRKAMDCRCGGICHRWRVPAFARDGLRPGGAWRFFQPAGTQGGHHSGRCQPTLATIRGRSNGASRNHV